MTDLLQFSVNLPDQVTIQYTTPGIEPDTPKPSYIDLDITGGTTLDGVYDSYCIDTDLGFEEDVPYTANVFSSYEPLPSELVGPGRIEFPENLDLVNWIINQCFVGKTSDAGGNFTFGDVQRAIWGLMDDENSTSGLGFFSQARADEIVALAMANGEGFVPSFEYETIFGEQVTGKLAVILAPDDNGDGVADHQIVVAEVPLSRIGDFVFLDDNEDGIQDTGEGGLEGVTVNLLADSDGDGEIDDVIATTTTDANGEYQFDVIAGDYKVEFVQPPDFEGSPSNVGGDDTVDSDGLISDLISVAPGEENPTIDQGFFFNPGGGDPVAGLGNFVFEDTNANGIQDEGEEGIDGVEVKLLADNDGDGVFDDVIDTTTTGDDPNTPELETGYYEFTNLTPGDYKVMFTQPTGFDSVSPFQAGDDTAVDSDADPNNGLMSDVVNLESGEFDPTIDAGFYNTAGLGDFVFEDLNQNGIQDAGEVGIDGVEVKLLADSDGDGEIDDVIATTTTGDNPDTTEIETGYYEFTDLTPGDYKVMFTQPTGFNSVSPFQEGEDPTVDSDADPNNGLMSDVVNLESGEFDPTIDAGFFNGFDPSENTGLGNFVFEDTNANGIQDEGEEGIDGVEVKLLADNDGDGVFDDVIATTTTGDDPNTTEIETGYYEFTDLTPGDYKVMFTQPTGFDSVSPFQAGDDTTVDSDADPDNGLMSDVVTLESGEFDETIDAGFFNSAGLGDFVFEDSNGNGIQDDGEAGVANVLVKLQNPDGSAVVDDNGNPITTTTDENGEYSFTGLTPGEYKVMFVAPEGFEFTTANVGDDSIDSDADPTMDGMTQVVTLTSGEFNDTLDAGLIRPASLGDFVFEDSNGNGIQDAGEEGVEGVTVTLTGGGEDGVIGTNDDTTETITTDDNGEYLFEGLNPGEEYKVTFSDLPEGFVFTAANQGGDDSKDSDADPSNGMSEIVTLESGENNLTIDAGILQTAGLGDFVFEDSNGNGIQDDGEAGVANVLVKLQNPDGSAVVDDNGNPITTTTDENGEYSFTGLTPGEYKVMFVAPEGFEFTTANVGDDSIDSDADPTMDGMTQVVTLTSGEFNDTLDAGLIRPASLGDFVFEDSNGNGIQDAGEEGVEGVTVTLTGGGEDGVIGTNDDTTETITTDDNGEYLFEGLNPGEEYKVTFSDLPEGFVFTAANQGGDDSKDSDADPSNGMSEIVTLESGENNLTIDAGILQTAGLGDFVFEDSNGNGIQDDGEAGVANVLVKLQNPDGSAVVDDNGNPITTTTDENGEYSFTGLTPGEYKVMFVAPEGFEFTTANVGDDALDSDADPTMDGMTQVVTLTSGEFNDTLDAGLIRPASLGDFVFEDSNGNGIQDAGEEGVEGVTVTLTGGGEDGVIGTNDDTTETITTDDNGEYLFEGLNPGEEYKVTFSDLPEGFVFTAANQGGDDSKDSDADPSNGMSEIVTLESGENNLTIDAGILQTAGLGDFVFEDSNGNGIQDDGEAGVANVLVKLQNPDGSAVVDDNGNPITTTTDENGEYSFTGLTPGEYKVMFVAPEGFEFTTANVGDDALDSDADPTMDGMTQVVTLTSGEFNDTLDAGLIRPASLGDFVFEDSNGNGIQDAGEEGVEGVTVTLTGGGEDGVIGTNDDTTETITTDDNGEYLFEGLNPGEEYKVTFSDLPEGFVFTAANQGGDDSKDSDADPSNGMSEIVTLESGENNLTIDAGILQTAGLGDFVFEDSNGNGIQDDGEAGVANVLVKLQNPDGSAVVDDNGNPITTTTDENGEYSFTGLTPGEYKVMFVAPEGFEFTTANVGDDALDSDADPTMDGMTQVVTLTSGEFNDTLDAGLIRPTPGIDIEKFVNGADADTEAEAVEILPGDDAVFTYEVTNTGEVAFAANEVIVTDDNGTAGDTSDDFNPEQVLANGFNTGDTNQNNALDSGETWFYTKTVAAEDLSTSTTITTNQVIDFEGFAAGTVIDNEYASLGVTISATGGSNQAMIFDSANPTGGDHDLETPGYGNNNTTAQGNILIISEDGDSSDPDDNAGGGTITFTFDNAVNVNSLSFVDIEESGGKVFTTDADGNVTTTNIAAPGDNSFQTLTINDDDVVKLEVDLVGSGSISSVDFDSIETSTAPGIYTNIGEVVAGNVNDEDAANYVNPTPEPGIDIEKFVNGIDANSPDEYPELTPGDDVTFTYDVTNTGNVAFAAADVIVTDDNGTPDDTSDDFNPDQVLVNGFNVGDVNQNNQLDATEIWKYSETLTVEDLSSSETIRIEAEDLHLYNYGVEHGDFASGGELIALHGHEGTASTTFSGETGQYDVIVGYYDENDGHATGKFKLNGQIIDSWTFEEDLGSNLPNEDTFVTRTVAEHITIEYGDSLTLKGIEDDYEFARFDYIELVKKGDEDGIYENVATVEAGDVSDSDMSGYVNPEGEPEPQPSQNSLLFSLKDHQNLDGINFEPEDIVEYNLADQSFSKFFDGSDVGLEGFKIDAFEVISDNEILLSFKYAQDIGGIHVDDSDIVKFTATSLGDNTNGSFDLYFDGSDVGLTENDEDIDGLSVDSLTGDLLVSTKGNVHVSGIDREGQDILRFNPDSLGSHTSGTWSVEFDGSDVNLTDSSENVDAIGLNGEQILLSTKGDFDVTGVSGTNEDVFAFNPDNLGISTSGTFEEFFNELNSNNITGVHFLG